MVDIIDSGLSGHLIAPNFAALLLPFVRAGPDWYRWLVNTVTYFAGFLLAITSADLF